MQQAICLISSLMVFLAAMIIACALIVTAILSKKNFNLNCSISHPNESTETESTPLSDIVPDHQWIWWFMTSVSASEINSLSFRLNLINFDHLGATLHPLAPLKVFYLNFSWAEVTVHTGLHFPLKPSGDPGEPRTSLFHTLKTKNDQ